MSTEFESKVAGLAPEARKRIEGLLKASVERELAASASRGDVEAMRKEFSKGWFFSRSRPCGLRPEEEVMLENAVRLDDGTFAKFADQLATLKALKNR